MLQTRGGGERTVSLVDLRGGGGTKVSLADSNGIHACQRIKKKSDLWHHIPPLTGTRLD